jgi:hypothetical protein
MSVASVDSSVMQRDPSGIAFKAVLSGTMHFDFTDLAIVAPLTCSLLGLVGRTSIFQTLNPTPYTLNPNP